jgi:hypothetical protein
MLIAILNKRTWIARDVSSGQWHVSSVSIPAIARAVVYGLPSGSTAALPASNAHAVSGIEQARALRHDMKRASLRSPLQAEIPDALRTGRSVAIRAHAQERSHLSEDLGFVRHCPAIWEPPIAEN